MKVIVTKLNGNIGNVGFSIGKLIIESSGLSKLDDVIVNVANGVENVEITNYCKSDNEINQRFEELQENTECKENKECDELAKYIVSMYETHKLSIDEISRRVGKSFQWVRKVLATHGAEIRPQGNYTVFEIS